MTVTQIIAALDRLLAAHGEDATLTRFTLGPNGTKLPNSVRVRAQVNGYTPAELVQGSGIVQGDSRVIFSPSEINDAKWPGTMPSNPKTTDPRIPISGDQIMISGRACDVKHCAVRRMDGKIVRFEAQVRG